MKVLITRTDRLGDLVLALPVIDLLHRLRPDWRLQMLVAPGLEAVVAGHPALQKIHTWSDTWNDERSRSLQEDLRGEGFSAALLLQYRRELALLLRGAKLKKILGPRSKPSSWFLLHQGKRQGRSRSGKHEADLNLELACLLACLPADERRQALTESHRPRVHLTPQQQTRAAQWRLEEAPGAAQVVFIHPGSGGSALDWGSDRFAALANQLARRSGFRVFVTGSAADARMVKAVADQLDPPVKVLLERFTLSQFMGVLAKGDVLVAPSTGPLHLAAAVGTPTVGLFAPAPVLSPVRWGQRGPQAVHLLPEATCPAKRRCTQEKCRHYNCLDTITPATVVDRVTGILAERTARTAGKKESS